MKNVNTNTVAETVSDLADEAVEKASKAANKAADKIAEKGDQLKNAEQRLVKEASNYVRDNPITSISIAVGVGFLLSKLFNNR